MCALNLVITRASTFRFQNTLFDFTWYAVRTAMPQQNFCTSFDIQRNSCPSILRELVRDVSYSRSVFELWYEIDFSLLFFAADRFSSRLQLLFDAASLTGERNFAVLSASSSRLGPGCHHAVKQRKANRPPTTGAGCRRYAALMTCCQ